MIRHFVPTCAVPSQSETFLRQVLQSKGSARSFKTHCACLGWTLWLQRALSPERMCVILCSCACILQALAACSKRVIAANLRSVTNCAPIRDLNIARSATMESGLQILMSAGAMGPQAGFKTCRVQEQKNVLNFLHSHVGMQREHRRLMSVAWES